MLVGSMKIKEQLATALHGLQASVFREGTLATELFKRVKTLTGFDIWYEREISVRSGASRRYIKTTSVHDIAACSSCSPVLSTHLHS